MQIAVIDKKISKAINLVSVSQIYQIKLFIFLCLVWVQIAYHSLINAFMFTNPLFKLDNKIETQAYCCLSEHQNQCVYSNNMTGTYYAGLYCENRDIRMGLQSLFAIGSIIGVVFIPIVSDSKGKKFAIFVSLLSILVGDVSLYFGISQKIYFLIAIGQILCALGANAALAVTYSINSDFFSDDLRQKAVIYYCTAWGLADMSIILAYYFMPQWLLYLLFLLFLPITLLFIYFRTFFLQSAHFAINSKHDFQLANQTVQKLAEYNNSSPDQLKQAKQVLKQLQNNMSNIKQNRTQKQQTTSQTLRLIFNNRKYLKALIGLTFIKMAYYSFYFGVQGSLERTGFNLGISVFLLGFGQFTGYATGSKFIPKLHRRKVIFVTNFLLVLFTIVFLTQTVKQSPFIASILLYVCFVLSSYNFSAMGLIQTESFPSSVRSTCIGLAFGTAYIVRIAMPFLIGFLNERKIQPIIASSILILIVGVLPPLVIDQTYGYSNLQQPLVPKQVQLTQQGINFEKSKSSKNVLENF